MRGRGSGTGRMGSKLSVHSTSGLRRRDMLGVVEWGQSGWVGGRSDECRCGWRLRDERGLLGGCTVLWGREEWRSSCGPIVPLPHKARPLLPFNSLSGQTPSPRADRATSVYPLPCTRALMC